MAGKDTFKVVINESDPNVLKEKVDSFIDEYNLRLRQEKSEWMLEESYDQDIMVDIEYWIRIKCFNLKSNRLPYKLLSDMIWLIFADNHDGKMTVTGVAKDKEFDKFEEFFAFLEDKISHSW